MEDKTKKYFKETITGVEQKDYNYDLFSSITDNVAYILSKSKVVSFTNGAVIKYLADQNTLLSNFDSMTALDYPQAVSDGTYDSYPFSMAHHMELRARYLLQTSSTDNFLKLKEELFTLIEPLFFEGNMRLPVLRKVMEEAEARLYKSKYKFVGPVSGHEQNEVEVLTDVSIGVQALVKYEEDGETVSKENSITQELRTDNHDMLALKELILVLRKEKKIDRFSIGLSFFNKYMPELDALGIKNILMTVKDGEIINFQMNPYIGKEKEYKQDFGVQKAASAMAVLEQLSRFPEGKPLLGDNELVFVSTMGYVATRSNLDFGDLRKNIMNDVSLCSETFVYEKHNDEVYGTRLCFTPMNYEDFPLIVRNGSVIFGLHDYSFHSAVKINPEKFPLIRNLFLRDFQDDWHTSAGWIAGSFENNNFEKLNESGESDNFYFYRPENEEKLMKVINSYYEDFPYTYTLYSRSFSSDRDTATKYGENTKPLHKRMTLGKFVNENTLEYLPFTTTWEGIASSHHTDTQIASIQRMHLRDDVMKVVAEEGLSLDDAIAKVLKKENRE